MTPLDPELTDDPFRVSGEGSCLMLEWSQPTVVAAARFMDHLKNQYGIFVKDDNVDASLSSHQQDKDESNLGEDRGQGWLGTLPRLEFGFQLTDVNLFVCALTPGMLVLQSGFLLEPLEKLLPPPPPYFRILKIITDSRSNL